jgi:hypothetical protein
MLRAEEVIEAQRDLILRLDDEMVRRYHGNVCVSPYVERMLQIPHQHASEEYFEMCRQSGDAVARGMQNVLRVAYAFQVTADMTPLIIKAADGLRGTDHFNREMMPTQAGFVRFEQPLPVTDVAGKTMLVHWMLWGPAGHFISEDGVFTIWMWNDHKVEPDDIAKEILSEEKFDALTQRIGRWGGCMGMETVTRDMRVGPNEVVVPDWKRAAYEERGLTTVDTTNPVRYIYTLWLLLQQTIVAQREVPIPRSHRKIARRMGIPEGVTVIELRRTSNNSQPGETMVEWSHRWIVRGGWQWRKCGPEHPFAQPYEKGYRCRVWVREHVKGPDDKPLVLTDKLYRLKR